MKQRIRLMLVLALITLGVASPRRIQAQPGSTPLLAWVIPAPRAATDLGDWLGGHIGAWADQGATRMWQTDWGFNYEPVLSPDGKWVAYQSIARFFVEALDLEREPANVSGWETPQFFPQNIWIANAVTGESSRIADQLANASVKGRGNYILRSRPVWSPDSTALAWAEIDLAAKPGTGTSHRLVIYDLAHKKAQFTPLGISVEGLPAHVNWRSVGLAVYLTERMPTDASATRKVSVTLYDPKGQLVTRLPDDGVYRGWIKDGTQDYLFKEITGPDKTRHTVLFDPVSGKTRVWLGDSEWYSPAAPDGLRLTGMGTGSNRMWYVVHPNGSAVALPDAWNVTISPDGQHIVYTKGKRVDTGVGVLPGDVFIYSNGQVHSTSITNANGLVWGSIELRVRKVLPPK
jgi:hypothetical protein